MAVHTKRTEKDKTNELAEEFLLLENQLSVSFRIPLLTQWTDRNGMQTNMEEQMFIHLKLMI